MKLANRPPPNIRGRRQHSPFIPATDYPPDRPLVLARLGLSCTANHQVPGTDKSLSFPPKYFRFMHVAPVHWGLIFTYGRSRSGQELGCHI
jgi:hypothetical protein